MKFGDKLMALRKKNGLSQEDLAAKLNVSRQSVSKWESNNTYPETDKIVQICNIFDCSMDDLINENIKDLSAIERKEKNNINVVIDSLLEFITKSINMFVSMTFTSGLKCIIEFMIIGTILAIIGIIGSDLTASIICRIVGFLPYNTIHVLRNIIEGIFLIVWTILTLIILVHTFKRRYLDYYDIVIKEQKKDESKQSQTVKVKKEEEKIIIGKEKKPQFVKKYDPFAFLTVLSKMILWFAKFFTLFIVFGLAITLFLLIILFVVLLPLCFHSLIFIGADVGIIGACVITVLFLIFLINFILGRRTNYRLITSIFLIALTVAGVGVGVSIIGLKDIEIKDNVKQNATATYEETVDYTDISYIYNTESVTEYIIDDNIPKEKIIISTKYDNSLNKISISWFHNYDMLGYQLYQYTRPNFKKVYEMLIEDLDNKILRDYSDFNFETITVKASKETIDKLLENLSKMYLYEKKETTNGYLVSNVSNKISISYGDYYCDASYSAVTDSMKFNSDCTCQRQNIETPAGVKIKYQCSGKSDDNEY